MLTWLLLAGPEETLLGPQPWLSLTDGSLLRVGAQGSLILLGKSLLSFDGAMPATRNLRQGSLQLCRAGIIH